MRQMQDRRHAVRALLEAHGAPGDARIRRPPASRRVRAPPACGRAAARTVRAPAAALAVHRHAFDIGVAGEQQMRVERLEERRAVLARVRPREQIEQRMAVALGLALIEQQRHRGGVLRDQLHRAMHDGVLQIALARQRRIVARRPARAPAGFEGEQPCARAKLSLPARGRDLFRRLNMIVPLEVRARAARPSRRSSRR